MKNIEEKILNWFMKDKGNEKTFPYTALAMITNGRSGIFKVNSVKYYYHISEYTFIYPELIKLETPKIELEICRWIGILLDIISDLKGLNFLSCQPKELA